MVARLSKTKARELWFAGFFVCANALTFVRGEPYEGFAANESERLFCYNPPSK